MSACSLRLVTTCKCRQDRRQRSFNFDHWRKIQQRSLQLSRSHLELANSQSNSWQDRLWVFDHWEDLRPKFGDLPQCAIGFWITTKICSCGCLLWWQSSHRSPLKRCYNRRCWQSKIFCASTWNCSSSFKQSKSTDSSSNSPNPP